MVASEKILRDLGVLALVKQNDKLLTEGEFFALYTPTATRGLFRLMYRENRELNMLRAASLIRESTTTVTNILAEQSIDPTSISMSMQTRIQKHTQMKTCARIMKMLRASISGFENLKATYCDDVAIVCRIDTIIAEIKDFLMSTEFISTPSTSPENRALTIS